MVARAAPRELEELLKDALLRTVKTPRVRRETVERLALRGSGSPSQAPSISRSRTEQKRRCQQEEDAWVPSWW
ncbi:hypothetical protein NDU88_003495 [Pleurodeles waltl]|uniref:Uncharacterized protein n=1 Tax=Pleurodeles waltl TaxID=8319 RepID=A0AAV7LJ15_PLEWA|nr:hypothetical protein NDU88_003495 [Pleurodeles waltl]